MENHSITNVRYDDAEFEVFEEEEAWLLKI
jgi:hypothetical protein